MRFFLLMSVSILGFFAESLTETTQSKERMRIFLAFVNMCIPRDQTGIHNKHVQICFKGNKWHVCMRRRAGNGIDTGKDVQAKIGYFLYQQD